jgi:hypothetical protein
MIIKSKRTRWTGHVAGVGEMMNAYKLLSENLKGGDASKTYTEMGWNRALNK